MQSVLLVFNSIKKGLMLDLFLRNSIEKIPSTIKSFIDVFISSDFFIVLLQKSYEYVCSEMPFSIIKLISFFNNP